MAQAKQPSSNATYLYPKDINNVSKFNKGILAAIFFDKLNGMQKLMLLGILLYQHRGFINEDELNDYVRMYNYNNIINGRKYNQNIKFEECEKLTYKVLTKIINKMNQNLYKKMKLLILLRI